MKRNKISIDTTESDTEVVLTMYQKETGLMKIMKEYENH